MDDQLDEPTILLGGSPWNVETFCSVFSSFPPVHWIPRATIATATTSLEKSGAGEVDWESGQHRKSWDRRESSWHSWLPGWWISIKIGKFHKDWKKWFWFYLIWSRFMDTHGHISYAQLIPRDLPGACGRFVSASISSDGCPSPTSSSEPSSRPTCRWMRPPKESWIFQLLGTGWMGWWWLVSWLDDKPWVFIWIVINGFHSS